jgi:hypothetical protein
MTLFASAPAIAEPTCKRVTDALYGISLGQIHNFPDGLRKGLVREGTAEVIAGLGFESIEGEVDSIVYPRIMAFYDRGSFNSVIAVGAMRRERDHGFGQILERVAAASQTTSQTSGEGAEFACEESIELSVSKISWDDGRQYVKVRVSDSGAQQRANQYIKEYCADPQKRRPQDACR